MPPNRLHLPDVRVGLLADYAFTTERKTAMNYLLHALLASERAADLRRSADEYRRLLPELPTDDSPASSIVIRLASEQDAATLRELAELDEAPMPAGQLLLAVVGGEVISALSLEDGAVIANPFVRSADAVTLLRVRAEHLSSPRRRRWRAIPRLRLA